MNETVCIYHALNYALEFGPFENMNYIPHFLPQSCFKKQDSIKYFWYFSGFEKAVMTIFIRKEVVLVKCLQALPKYHPVYIILKLLNYYALRLSLQSFNYDIRSHSLMAICLKRSDS